MLKPLIVVAGTKGSLEYRLGRGSLEQRLAQKLVYTLLYSPIKKEF